MPVNASTEMESSLTNPRTKIRYQETLMEGKKEGALSSESEEKT